MSDFDDLRRIRDAKENSETLARQKKLEEERRRADAAKRLEDRIAGYTQSFDDVVINALEDLRRAVYPDLSMDPLSIRNDLLQAFWAIMRPTWRNEYLEYFPAVSVTLEYNNSGEPLRFRVYREAVIVEEIVPMKKSIKSRLLGITGIESEDLQYRYRSNGGYEVCFKPIVCGLSGEELVQALRTLHPPHTVSARPA